MKKRTRGVLFRIIVSFSLILFIGGAFCYTLLANPEGANLADFFQYSLIPSETVYLLAGLCILFAVSLVWLLCCSFSTTSAMQKVRRAWAQYENKKNKKVKTAPRFAMLNQIDHEFGASSRRVPKYDDSISLEQFCLRFRDFAANRLHLYYRIEDIRRFVAGLGVSKLLILQGMSGTGKTSLAYAMGQFLQNDAVVVPVQPMWKERSDMIGYFNEFTKRFNETVLLRKMYEAGYCKDPYITILDEVNISRVEYYFAEFLSLLELPDENKRYLDVVSDVWPNDPVQLKEGRVKLPANMWFIGTANNDDSTFAISDKVYDRAMVLSLEHKCEPYEAESTDPIRISIDHWNKLIEQAMQTYSLSQECEKKIRQLDEYLIETFKLSFGNRIMKQITAYVPIMIACGGDELQAVDDILSRKVFRKLESQNPTYIRNAVDGLSVRIDELFGSRAMPQSVEYLELLKNTL